MSKTGWPQTQNWPSYYQESNILSPGSFRYSMHRGFIVEYEIYCFMVSDFTQDFQSSRGVQNVLKTQYKCNIDEIPITTLYDMLTGTVLGIPSHWEATSNPLLSPGLFC